MAENCGSTVNDDLPLTQSETQRKEPWQGTRGSISSSEIKMLIKIITRQAEKREL